MNRGSSMETVMVSGELFKMIHCSSGDDNHFVQDAKILPCYHHICNNCVENAFRKEVKCNTCDTKYKITQELLDKMVSNPTIEPIIVQHEVELRRRLEDELKNKVEFLKEKKIEERIDENFNTLSKQINERYNDLQKQLENSRNKLLNSLEELQIDFKNTIKNEEENPGDVDEFLKEFERKSTDGCYFFEFENAFRETMKKLNGILYRIPKVSFEEDSFIIDEKIIGQIINTFPFKKIHDNPDIDFEFVSSMTYLTKSNEVVVANNEKNTLTAFEFPKGPFRTAKLKQYLKSPCSIVANKKNEIFVADQSKKIHVFDSNFNFLRKFIIQHKLSIDMAIDESNNNLYLAHFNENCVTVWNGTRGEFETMFEIKAPLNVKVNDKFIFVLSNSSFFDNNYYNYNNLTKEYKDSNCIVLLDKYKLSIEKIIKMDNWIDPRTIYLDRNTNIITTALVYKDDGNLNEYRYFYIFDFDGNCILKKKSTFTSLTDMLVINRSDTYIIDFYQNS